MRLLLVLTLVVHTRGMLPQHCARAEWRTVPAASASARGVQALLLGSWRSTHLRLHRPSSPH